MSMSNTTKRVKEIRWNIRSKFSSEEKIRIVLDGLRGSQVFFQGHRTSRLRCEKEVFYDSL